MSRDAKVIIVDTRNASDYERDQIREIAEWKGRSPSTASLWLGRFAAPLDKAIRSALTEETVENALAEANRIAGSMLRDAAGTPRAEDLHEADERASSSRKWAVGYAAAGGAGAGAAGFAGLVIDIPFTVTMALRAIRRIGADYGYTGDNEADFAMRALAVAAANTPREKDEALAQIEAESGEISTRATSRATVAKDGAIFATRSIAAALARNLAGRKAAQAIPVVGAAIGAAASAAFLDDVCTAARRMYQERFLRDNNVLEAPIG